MKRITPFTWVATIISVAAGSVLMSNANTFAEGMVHVVCAGTVIGLVNLGIHEIYWKYKKKGTP